MALKCKDALRDDHTNLSRFIVRMRHRVSAGPPPACLKLVAKQRLTRRARVDLLVLLVPLVGDGWVGTAGCITSPPFVNLRMGGCRHCRGLVGRQSLVVMAANQVVETDSEAVVCRWETKMQGRFGLGWAPVVRKYSKTQWTVSAGEIL